MRKLYRLMHSAAVNDLYVSALIEKMKDHPPWLTVTALSYLRYVRK